MEPDVGENRSLLLLLSQQMSQILRRLDEQDEVLRQLNRKVEDAVTLETQYQQVQSAPVEPFSPSSREDDMSEWLIDLFHAWCCGCGWCYTWA